MAVTPNFTLSSEDKAIIAAFAAWLAANKAEAESVFAPFIAKMVAAVDAEAEKIIGEISDPILKSIAQYVFATFGPDLPTYINEFEGSEYDKLVAFLQKISA